MTIENKNLKVHLNFRLDTNKESINKLDGKKLREVFIPAQRDYRMGNMKDRLRAIRIKEESLNMSV